jgi:hypothetical protein
MTKLQISALDSFVTAGRRTVVDRPDSRAANQAISGVLRIEKATSGGQGVTPCTPFFGARL